jgi:hypothetical protein
MKDYSLKLPTREQEDQPIDSQGLDDEFAL